MSSYERKGAMNYTLITKTGKVYTFYILATAETYQKAYGGTLVTNEILLDKAGNLSVQYNHN
jgi:hypothetical protein